MKKSNVGILTLFDRINYGANLQVFALQTFLIRLGFDVEVIKYIPKTGIDNRSFFMKARSFIWKNTFKNIMKDKLRLERSSFFRDMYLCYTEKEYKTPEELKSECQDFHYYLVGSDQVWNPRYAGLDSSWFLTFAPKGTVKISYAASFGVSAIDEKIVELYSKYIDTLDYVSIREESGLKILSGMNLHLTPAIVMDPVFLLTKSEWSNLAKNIKKENDNYILCYYMPGNYDLTQKMKRMSVQYARNNNLKIINIGKRDIERIFDKCSKSGIGPLEFLSLVEHSESVYTNSFHGVAFSLIFQKKLMAFVDSSQTKNDLSTRITDLLTRLNQTGCLVDINSGEDAEPVKTINQDDETLKKNIIKSKEFIMKVMGNSEFN